jgi:hypothetical protein
MRYRALDENGDYTFGRGAGNFLVNSPAAVRQSIQTRLGLLQGEWYLNQQSGTPWLQQILVKGAVSKIYDLAIQTRILQTQGVKSIITYSSTVDQTNRSLLVKSMVQTIYSVDPINVDVTLGGSV